MNRIVRAAIVRKIKIRSPLRTFLPLIPGIGSSLLNEADSMDGIMSIPRDGSLPDILPEFISRYPDTDRLFAAIFHVEQEKLFDLEESSPMVLNRSQ